MFNKNDILERLAAGATIDDIADEMANTLNEAQADYLLQQAEKIKADELVAAKREAMRNIVTAVNDYLINFVENGEEYAVPASDEDIDELTGIIDRSIDMFKMLLPMTEFKVEAKKPSKKLKTLSADDAIHSFLNSFNLI